MGFLGSYCWRQADEIQKEGVRYGIVQGKVGPPSPAISPPRPAATIQHIPSSALLSQQNSVGSKDKRLRRQQQQASRATRDEKLIRGVASGAPNRWIWLDALSSPPDSPKRLWIGCGSSTYSLLPRLSSPSHLTRPTEPVSRSLLGVLSSLFLSACFLRLAECAYPSFLPAWRQS